MRLPLTSVLAVLAATTLLPVAAAQDTDGCLQTNPCLLDVEVDEQGIASVSISNLTSGDWFMLSVSNLDERTHTVSFAGASVQVGAFESADSAAFEAPAAGTYQIKDQPTGDQADIHVLAGDVVEAEDGAAEQGSNGSPPLSAAVLVAGLAAAVLLLRRRD